jgi:hypothetical protein
MTKWTTPDEDGNIHIPDELVDLVNAIALQVGSMLRSGKNEVQTICDIVSIAQEYFMEIQQHCNKQEIEVVAQEVKATIDRSACTPSLE